MGLVGSCCEVSSYVLNSMKLDTPFCFWALTQLLLLCGRGVVLASCRLSFEFDYTMSARLLKVKNCPPEIGSTAQTVLYSTVQRQGARPNKNV